jgi:peptidoglycan/xylan/chitin deacetylase (PgdA/CDA1 family)
VSAGPSRATRPAAQASAPARAASPAAGHWEAPPPGPTLAAGARGAASAAAHWLRWLAAVPLYHLGLVTLYLRRRERRLPQGELRVLRYHRVIPDDEPEPTYPLGVRRRSFAAQMRLLARHRPVDLAGAAAFLDGHDPGPGMRLLVTLDDGYRDNLTEGLPALLDAGVPALLFVTTGYVGSGRRFPWERLKRVVDDPRRDALGLPGGERLRLGRGARARRRAFARVHRWLEAQPEAEREALLALWESGRGPDPRNDGPLDWNEVRQLASRGIAIGSHTVRHLRLSRLPSPALEDELAESRRRLEEETGGRVETLAYPSGDHDARTAAAAAAAGYRLAFTTRPGSNRPGEPSMALRRKGIGEATAETPWGSFSPALFAVEVSGLYDHLLRRIFP